MISRKLFTVQFDSAVTYYQNGHWAQPTVWLFLIASGGQTLLLHPDLTYPTIELKLRIKLICLDLSQNDRFYSNL